MAVPNIFGTATAAIPLSQLDTNFATAITLGNTAVYLGNTTTSLGNVTLTNVTISSGNVTLTGANVSGTANISTLIVTGNQTSLGNVAITGNISANIVTVAAGAVGTPSITTTGDTNTGIFFPAADTIAFAEGGAEVARFDSSGNFGIGVTPSYRLEVKGPSATAGQLSIHDGTGDTVVSNTNAASLLFQCRDSSVRTLAEIDGVHTTTNGTGGAMVFQTRVSDVLAERMRIDSSGNLLVAQSATVLTGTIQFTFDGLSQQGMCIKNSANSQNGAAIRFIDYNNAYTGGGIYYSSSNSISYTTSSDYRLKENIAPMTGALAKVSALKPVTYTWKSEPNKTSEGFIAHELQAIIPQAVIGTKDEIEIYKDEEGIEHSRPRYQSIDTSFLITTLTAAIQEQQALITVLTARITALENK